MKPNHCHRTAVAQAVLGLVAGLVLPAPAWANHGATADPLPQNVVITGHYDNAVGSHDAASAGTVRREALLARPLQRPGEVLEFVPGVVVTQHSGEGKANQYFLRGFNLDHGTDFATRVAGMPVNMPSHGHGQGYSDLNFLIPELVQRIDYRKGPYAAAVGDFAAAGSADIGLVAQLPSPFAQLTLGADGHRRVVAAGSRAVADGLVLLAGLELSRGDGPWTVPQRARKHSGVVSLSGGTRARGWHLSAMGYGQRWTATDQIPERLLQPGTGFGRFDSLDATNGGDSARVSLSGEWHAEHESGRTAGSAYVIDSDLDLNSNFTYALERPADGDQFKQRDRRRTYGGELTRAFDHTLGSLAATTTLGLQLRHDRIRNGLYDSVARVVTATTREDRIRQTNTAFFGSTALELAPTLRAVLGLRADHLAVDVDALTLPANGGRADAWRVSPKATLVWAATPKTELYANAGRGLHSNDARGMTTRTDPKSGDPVDPVPTWVPVDGAEIGLRTEAVKGLQSSFVLWGLRSASELVYVGDAGGNEPSLASRRRGVEINQRWQPVPGVVVDADLAFNHARLSDGSRIPNAVDRVASVAVTLREWAGFDASLQWRRLGSAALVEDNSLRSRPASTVNLRVSRKLTPQLTLAVDVANLFDREVDDIQYGYESQLPGEAAPVFDRHIHPAEPRRVRLTLRGNF
jgi:outer membrane receptor protein involved in Fe transport